MEAERTLWFPDPARSPLDSVPDPVKMDAANSLKKCQESISSEVHQSTWQLVLGGGGGTAALPAVAAEQ